MPSFEKHIEKRATRIKVLLACVLLVSVSACSRNAPGPPAQTAPSVAEQPARTVSTADAAGTATAIFAGGCFWCMKPPYDTLPGVIATTSGYTAGRTVNPSYQQVSSGGTGHTEALQESGRFPRGIGTEIEPASTFYPTEEYHQDYYVKNPSHYKFYRFNSGRDRRLRDVWENSPLVDTPKPISRQHERNTAMSRRNLSKDGI
jgi:peptide-methionine (S)-S-oxide reductase